MRSNTRPPPPPPARSLQSSAGNWQSPVQSAAAPSSTASPAQSTQETQLRPSPVSAAAPAPPKVQPRISREYARQAFPAAASEELDTQRLSHLGIKTWNSTV